MKRIAIVSPYKGYNYGTVLQAYALQRKIEEFGFDAEYLQFSPQIHSSRWKKILRKALSFVRPNKKHVKNVGLDDYSFFYTPDFREFVKGFDYFISSRIKESETRFNPDSLRKCRDYVAYIVGSDQTWGEGRTLKNPIYFLNYIDERYPRFSYAPSIGTTHISQEYLKVLRENLPRFQFLSCRELTNCKLLSKEIGRDVSYVLDPTLLLTSEEWNQIAEKHPDESLKKKQYILCYILGEKKSISDYAEKLGKEKSLPVYYIVTRPLYLKKEKHIFATPETFLGLVRDADTVITDSFHGTIFSINFNTQFYSFTKRENDANVKDRDNDRIVEILQNFDLSNRYREKDFKIETDIDYIQINQILKENRKKSLQYIDRMLSFIK